MISEIVYAHTTVNANHSLVDKDICSTSILRIPVNEMNNMFYKFITVLSLIFSALSILGIPWFVYLSHPTDHVLQCFITLSKVIVYTTNPSMRTDW